VVALCSLAKSAVLDRAGINLPDSSLGIRIAGIAEEEDLLLAGTVLAKATWTGIYWTRASVCIRQKRNCGESNRFWLTVEAVQAK
jgi:hypothetical protein